MRTILTGNNVSCVLQKPEKYRVLWTDFLGSLREINRFSVSKIGPEPAKPTISLALGQANRPKLICPFNFFEVGGITNVQIMALTSSIYDHFSFDLQV